MATSIQITSWLRAFFALQECAMDGRGHDEIVHDDDIIRWPRTRGSDVAVIAAMFDPYLRAQRLRFGGHGLPRRWRVCIDELAHAAPDLEYPQNRAFWRTLPAICLYLHSHSVPLPAPVTWSALLARLRDDRATPALAPQELHARTVRPPFP